MSKGKLIIHALEFSCQAPLKFYERCSSCPRFENGNCPDLNLGIELLQRKKKLVYNENTKSKEAVCLNQFNCLLPVHYFEKTRKQCPHMGRCREEGLLMALLNKKRGLTYAHKDVLRLPTSKFINKKYQPEEMQSTKGINFQSVR